MTQRSEIASVADVCEVETFSPAGAESRGGAQLLIEIPHGATRACHYAAIRGRLVGEYPDKLQDYFFVNTDVGAPECAREAARLIAEPEDPASRARQVLIVRSLIPRTFIDCNRTLDAAGDDYGRSGITAAIPEYVVSKADRELLTRLYRAYVEVAERAYAHVCGEGAGTAIMLHTYAPRSVKLDHIDVNVGTALREAYAPERYATWETRPDVDFITETVDGKNLAPPDLLAAVRSEYEKIGIRPTENVSYRLHPSTLGCRFSARFEGRVLCMELSRSLLADPFTPFEEMQIGRAKAARMAAPLASGYLKVR